MKFFEIIDYSGYFLVPGAKNQGFPPGSGYNITQLKTSNPGIAPELLCCTEHRRGNFDQNAKNTMNQHPFLFQFGFTLLRTLPNWQHHLSGPNSTTEAVFPITSGSVTAEVSEERLCVAPQVNPQPASQIIEATSGGHLVDHQAISGTTHEICVVCGQPIGSSWCFHIRYRDVMMASRIKALCGQLCLEAFLAYPEFYENSQQSSNNAAIL